MLSELASIYDPIGWIGPIVLTAKLFMNQLWLLKLDWKDELPEEMKEKWTQFRNMLTLINQIKIPRYCLQENYVFVELHGFCDASIKAYGAVIYLRSYDSFGNIKVSLICSK